jgi:hypothetical protein
MKRTIVAAMAGAVLLAASSAASAQVCILGIFAVAAQVGATEHRELTQKEAFSCGLSRLFEPQKPEPKKKEPRHKKEQ